MPHPILFRLLFTLFVAFSLLAPQWSHSQIFSFAKERLEPKHKNIRFWDDKIGDYRGIRMLFYTVPQEQENRLLDKRLYQNMTNLLAFMSEKIITMDSFSDISQKRMVENVFSNLVDQWHVQGKVDPAAFFHALPFLDIDVVVLMERTRYDQVWRKEQKKLMIGLNIVMFEMDYGEPLFSNSYYNELPWQGERTIHLKVEQKALLDIADALGASMVEIAKLINKAHDAEVREQILAANAAERQRQEKLRKENENLARLVKQAESAMKPLAPETSLRALMAEDVQKLKALLRVPVNKLTPEQAYERNQLGYNVQVYLEQIRPSGDDSAAQPSVPFNQEGQTPVYPFGGDDSSWTQDDRFENGYMYNDTAPDESAFPSDTGGIQSQPIPDSGGFSPSLPMRPMPSVPAPTDDILDRSWLLPKASSALIPISPGIQPLAPPTQTRPAERMSVPGQLFSHSSPPAPAGVGRSALPLHSVRQHQTPSLTLK